MVNRFVFGHPSPPGDRQCDGVGFVSAGSVRLKLRNTLDFPRYEPRVIVALPASLSARSFSFTSRHVQDSTSTGVSEEECRTF